MKKESLIVLAALCVIYLIGSYTFYVKIGGEDSINEVSFLDKAKETGKRLFYSGSENNDLSLDSMNIVHFRVPCDNHLPSDTPIEFSELTSDTQKMMNDHCKRRIKNGYFPRKVLIKKCRYTAQGASVTYQFKCQS